VATSLALLVFAASPSFAVNGNIGVYADQGQAICAADLGYQTTLTLYVYGLLQGGSIGGIQGAEYSIIPNVATDWIYSESFAPTDVQLGTSAINGVTPGVNLAWGSCQSAGPIFLQSIDVLDVSGNFAGTPVTLTVSAHSEPSNPFFRCPTFVLCDDPTFTKVCLGSNQVVDVCPFPPGAVACEYSTSGEFFINPEPGFNCTVAVQQKTWTEVKSLYNN
jgi:hypothetical protein